MRSFAVRYGSFRDAISVACRRLVNAAGTSGPDLEVRLRLTGILLGAPVVVGAAVALILSRSSGPASIVVALCATFLATWLAGLIVAQHGRERAIGALALAAAAALAAVLTAAGGGAASPMLLLAAALVFEPWWVWRTDRALRYGAVAAGAAAAGAFALSPLFPDAAPAFWYWLPALGYALTVAARLHHERAGVQPPVSLETDLDAVVLRVSDKGDVLTVSGGSDQVPGVSPRHLLGQGLFERLHVGDRVAYMCALSDLRNGASRRTAELRLRLPGDAKPVETYRLLLAEFVAAEGGQPACSIVLRSGERIEGLRRELAEARDEIERLSIAKSHFLASVSHELRTPLNAIIGFSDMLLHELYGRLQDGRQREHIGHIKDAGTHLLGVVNSILDVSKLELNAYEIYAEEFAFDEAVKMCASMMSVQADAKGIALEAETDPAIGYIKADRRAVQQMLINLVSNAVKFAPEGGRVRIEAELSGDDVEFRVRDNGMGIAETDLARIGQPFVQVSSDYARRHEGTGLGLALVKGLVRLHGGTMSIASVLGGGTTVTIRLPKAGAAAAALADASAHDVNEGENGSYRKTA